jgi:recombinational DNA repair ATPase RecF
MSELDPDRRAMLLELLETAGQTLITTADSAAVPAGAVNVVELEDPEREEVG